MKKIFFSIVTLVLIVSSSFAQNANDNKVIVWLSEKKDVRIQNLNSFMVDLHCAAGLGYE